MRERINRGTKQAVEVKWWWNGQRRQTKITDAEESQINFMFSQEQKIIMVILSGWSNRYLERDGGLLPLSLHKMAGTWTKPQPPVEGGCIIEHYRQQKEKKTLITAQFLLLFVSKIMACSREGKKHCRVPVLRSTLLHTS